MANAALPANDADLNTSLLSPRASSSSTLKSEIGIRRYPTRQEARASIFEFVVLFYDRVRV
jgi:hypothetical protein